MKQYIGLKITETDSAGHRIKYYKAYDLEEKFKGINEVYEFRLNDDFILEKTRSESDCLESEEYISLITQYDESSCIEFTIENGKYRLTYREGQPVLAEISDGDYQTLEIFPKVSSRSLHYQYPNKDLDLISISFCGYSLWDKKACAKEYEKWFSELDDEMLMEFVKTYARDGKLEVSLRMVDAVERTWRRKYTVRDSSPDMAFDMIKNNLMSVEAKIKLIGSMPEIINLFSSCI